MQRRQTGQDREVSSPASPGRRAGVQGAVAPSRSARCPRYLSSPRAAGAKRGALKAPWDFQAGYLPFGSCCARLLMEEYAHNLWKSIYITISGKSNYKYKIKQPIFNPNLYLAILTTVFTGLSTTASYSC